MRSPIGILLLAAAVALMPPAVVLGADAAEDVYEAPVETEVVPKVPDYLPTDKDMAPLKIEGEPEWYDPDRLWEKIDGEAELYVASGLTEAWSVLFTMPGNPDRRVDVTVFTLPPTLAAYGVFARFRRPDDTIAKLGNGGVIGEYQAFFWHGQYFVLADGGGPSETRRDDLQRAVEAVDDALGKPPREPAVLAFFEMTVLPGTIRYLPDHILGRFALPRGLEGKTEAGVEYFLATTRVDGVHLMQLMESQLSGARRFDAGAALGMTGPDPLLGPMTFAVRDGVFAGARARPESPGVMKTIVRLLEAPVEP
jgi:hypothetical protein